MSEFKIDKVENNQGSVSIGDSSSSTYVQQGQAENIAIIAKELIKLLDENKDLPQDTKDELTETINTISDQAELEKPNKTILKSLFSAADKMISLAVKTPELISVFEKWKGFIEPLF
ncbi:hypothetical protein [Paenibacillus sp. FSL L8-0494]|uniref:hypothetical protein n=1 Tax=Paenibacillus sp. FSL L8-0494 TaxID=2975352 RepID=UPI0030F6BDDD